MAEAILFAVAAEVLKKLASVTLRQISLTTGVKRDLKELEVTLLTIKAVLLDAEQKQSTNKSSQLSLWLERLQDVLYDVENVLDEFAYKALLQRLAATRGNSKTKVRHIYTSVTFRFGMGYKIKEIKEKLDQIALNRAQFHLTEGVIDRHVIPRDMTHSFVSPSDVIGRDKDIKTIVHLLRSSHAGLNLSVIPIVGIGGLGKTTVAKLVYNNIEVKEHFELRMWVCVSDDFDKTNLVKSIIKAATNGDDCSGLSIDLLQTRLRDILKKKRFLLVLDDVWNEDLEKWKDMEELLMSGVKESALIVTTRSHQVASIMRTTQPYILEGLPDKDCWSLFSKHAFEKGEEKNYPNLVRIGKEIIQKCKGVPLAMRSLGSMLFRKTDEHDWNSIKESEIWRLEENKNGILTALKLSYNQLSSHLKRCFTFCSVFPKDYSFNSEELIRMWMSQGLIQSSIDNEELEEMGLIYIKALSSRCFFQDITKYGNIWFFKMHDLVHDLALSIAQNECYTINNLHMPITKLDKFRHVSLQSTKECSPVLLDFRNLWTLFYVPISEGEVMSQSFVKSCITKFKFLRMLCMHHSGLEVLPESIGSLKHLRYLDISGNRNMKILPDAICKLLHLQMLKLIGCSELEGLPRDIGNLIELRSLSITAKNINLLPNKEIALLTSLRHLYISECPNVITSDERIECLPRLQTFALSKCNNIESWPGIMKHLPSLESLFIEECVRLNLMDDTIFTILKTLVIDGLPQLKSLPNWIQNLTSLHRLGIFSCPHIIAMPERISNLTSLREPRCKRGGEDWHKISPHSEDNY